MESYFDIIRGGKAKARELFEKGIAPDPKSIEGYEFDGCNLFAASKLFGIRKFRKGFFRNSDGQLAGYNIPISPAPDEGPWNAKPSNASPRHFGFYTVKSVDPTGRENLHSPALLLNYGEGNNSLSEGGPFLRDYLRQPFPSNPDIIIGAAYLALGPLRIFSNSCVLRRYGPKTFHGNRQLLLTS